MLIASITILPKVSYEQSTSEIINVNGTKYVISHTIEGGKILSVSLNTQLKTVIVMIQSTGDGNLSIDLPRILIDAKENSTDTHYVVLANSHGVNFKEFITTDYRELTIPFHTGTTTIEIKGTQVVPEFGPLISFVLLVSLLTVIGFIQKNKLAFYSKG